MRSKGILHTVTFGTIASIGLMTGCVFPPQEVHLYQTTGITYKNPVFSPDGKSILVQSKGDLLLLHPDGSLLSNLTQGAGSNYGPRWSPDGRWIIFTSESGGQKDICRIRPDGSDFTNLTKTTDKDEDYPVYSPDGTKIAFYRCEKKGEERVNRHLTIANSDGTGQRSFAIDGWNAWWSPDYKWIAYIDVRGNGIWIQSVDGGEKRKLVEGKPISWTPDGTAIFYRPLRGGFDKNADVCLMNIDGTKDRLVLKDYSVAECCWGDPQKFWDPSGSLLALVVYRMIGMREGGVVIVDRDGNIISDFRERGSEFDDLTTSWSRDGNWVLFRKSEFFPRGKGIGGVYLINVRTGQQRQVIADNTRTIELKP